MFDVGTLMSRRRLLGLFGAGAATVGLAACGAGSSSSGTSASSSSSSGSATTAASGEIPDETAGPYPGDGSNGPDVLEQSGIVRSDIRSSFGDASGTAEGIPMTLQLTISDLANGGVPFEGVAVYVWHCDREGGYSLYSTGLENENYLRGVQVAAAEALAEAQARFPLVPIAFCETRPLAQEWTYRWLGACLAELDAAARTAEIEATFASGGPVPAAAPRPAEVREWARAHGLSVSDRGRIRADIVRQYLAEATAPD